MLDHLEDAASSPDQRTSSHMQRAGLQMATALRQWLHPAPQLVSVLFSIAVVIEPHPKRMLAHAPALINAAVQMRALRLYGSSRRFSMQAGDPGHA